MAKTEQLKVVAQTVMLPIAKIDNNHGQVDGLPKNPRIIRDKQYEALKRSITEAPEMLTYRELLVYPFEGRYVVIGGNMRLRVLKDLGEKAVPCKVLPEDTPVEKLREYTVKDNVSGGEWDWDDLANAWDEEELEAFGLDLPDGWGEEEGESSAQEDDFDEAKDDVPTVCQRGDIWQLGDHRLMCGDSTDATDVALLMDGERADLVLTDPPYGIDVVSDDGKVGADFGVAKKGNYKKVIADETTDTASRACEMLLTMSDKVIVWGGNYFTKFLPFSDSWLIWDKRSDSGIRNTFADGEMAWCSFHTPVRIYHQLWNGMIREGEHEKRVHPTQKPVAMLGNVISDFSVDGAIVLDVFGGSGTTLIAAEQLHRKCYMMELDPHYCDVIIARWEKLTGGKATKITNINQPSN